MTKIIKRIKKYKLYTNNSNHPSTGYKGTTTTVKGTLTMLRMTKQRNHQMLKLLSKDP